MTTKTKPETTDQRGVVHRHGCSMPGSTAEPSRVAGFVLHRCRECGAVSLARSEIR